MIRRSLAAFLLLASAWLAPAAGRAAVPPGSGAKDPSIVLGMVVTLTGPGALAGQDILDGFSLALRQLGGRFANQEVRLVTVDDRGSPDSARSAVRKLMDRERLDMVLTGVAPSSLAAIAKPLTEARLFVLNLDTAPSAMTGAECSPWLFSLAAPSDGVHEAMGQHLAAEHVRRLAVVGPDSAMTHDAVAALKRTFAGEVAPILTPRPGATVFGPELAKLREVKPEAVYSLMTGGMGVNFLLALDRAGLKAEMPVFGPWSSFERQILPAMGDAAHDVTTIGTWAADLDTANNKRLTQEFEAEYGRPATTWAAQGYDAAMLLDAGLKATKGNTHDAEALRSALRRAEFSSVRSTFRFNTNHFPVLTYHVRKVVRDAKGRLVHETRAPVLREWRDRGAAVCPMRWVEEPAAPPPVPVKKPQ